MDAMIRLRACATLLAVAAVPALGSSVAAAATASSAQDPSPRAPARTAPAKVAVDAATTGTRSRPAGQSVPALSASSGRPGPVPAGPRKPLELTLTPAEFRSILDRYQADSGNGAHSAFDDVTVQGRAELQPMRDPVHEVWGGIAAPFWALLYPTQAWRIFLPIPPK
jgi:hypothetical protein